MVSNKQKLLEVLKSCSSELYGELHYHVFDVEHEYPYDYADAFEDVSDMYDTKSKIGKEICKIYIEIGYAVPWKKPIASIGSTIWFRIGKNKYEPTEPWSTWIEK